jgi:thiol-disulfide isomerase/thioredoxin
MLLAGSAALGGGLAAARAGAEPILTDDGLYTQPWFLESFLILSEDLDGAAAKAKRFAVMWDLKGCPYCKKTHLVNFADPEIAGFVKARFEILLLNIVGAREVTDFDGETLPEKRLAERYGIRGTPTVQFFPAASAGLAAKAPRDREGGDRAELLHRLPAAGMGPLDQVGAVEPLQLLLHQSSRGSRSMTRSASAK